MIIQSGHVSDGQALWHLQGLDGFSLGALWASLEKFLFRPWHAYVLQWGAMWTTHLDVRAVLPEGLGGLQRPHACRDVWRHFMATQLLHPWWLQLSSDVVAYHTCQKRPPAAHLSCRRSRCSILLRGFLDPCCRPKVAILRPQRAHIRGRFQPGACPKGSKKPDVGHNPFPPVDRPRIPKPGWPKSIVLNISFKDPLHTVT